MKQKIALFGIIAIALIAVIRPTHATTGASLSGWGWSSNIGWVYFGPTTVGGGVFVSTTTGPTTGTFAGYAWSSNLGWISFENADVSACGAQATVDLSTGQSTSGKVSGWARSLTEKNNGTGTKAGCIELSGSNHVSPGSATTGGVTLDMSTGAFRGYAWSSDDIGWLQFRSVVCPGCVGSNTHYGVILAGARCDINATSTGANNSINATFIVSVDPTNGIPPYSYSWDNGTNYSPGSKISSTTNYTATPPAGPIVKIIDSDSPVNVGSFSCPTVVVPTPPGGGNSCSINYNPANDPNNLTWSKNGYSSCELYTFSGTDYTTGATSTAQTVTAASGLMSIDPSQYARYSIFCSSLSGYKASPGSSCYSYSETGSSCTGSGCGVCVPTPGHPCPGNGGTNPGNGTTETEL